eukprot:g6212.t1
MYPERCYGLGKRTLWGKGWELMTIEGIDISREHLKSEIERILEGYRNDGSDDINHAHVGIYLDGQVLDYPDKVSIGEFCSYC